ncbi:MAG: hypothetical protein ABWZ64_12355 [Xanthobacteraceae bacterium]
MPRPFGGGERASRVADRQQRTDHFGKSRTLAAPQLGRGLTGSRELLLQGNRAIEDVLDQLGRHADGISEALCEIEHQTIGGLGSCRQRLLGTISLRRITTTMHIIIPF